MAVNKSIPRAETPAEVGVSSKVVKEFLNEDFERMSDLIYGKE